MVNAMQEVARQIAAAELFNSWTCKSSVDKYNSSVPAGEQIDYYLDPAKLLTAWTAIKAFSNVIHRAEGVKQLSVEVAQVFPGLSRASCAGMLKSAGASESYQDNKCEKVEFYVHEGIMIWRNCATQLPNNLAEDKSWRHMYDLFTQWQSDFSALEDEIFWNGANPSKATTGFAFSKNDPSGIKLFHDLVVKAGNQEGMSRICDFASPAAQDHPELVILLCKFLTSLVKSISVLHSVQKEIIARSRQPKPERSHMYLFLRTLVANSVLELGQVDEYLDLLEALGVKQIDEGGLPLAAIFS